MKIEVEYFIQKRIRFLRRVSEGKKIIIFGTGQGAKMLNQVIPWFDLASYYIDNNQEKEGKAFLGKFIKPAEEILKEEKDKYIIFVTPKKYQAINRQLEDWGLACGSDYLNLYEFLNIKGEFSSFVNTANQLIRFIDRIPEEKWKIISKSPERGKAHIGIICCNDDWGFQMNFPHCVVMYLMLRERGYHAELIEDSFSGIGDFLCYQGMSSDGLELMRLCLDYLAAKMGGVNLLGMSKDVVSDLTDEELKFLSGLADMNASWQIAQKAPDRTLQLSRKELSAGFYDVLKKQLPIIKNFFYKNSFDVIYAGTALHKSYSLYNRVGKEKNIRVFSMDGFRGVNYVSGNGPCSYQYDVEKVVRGNYFNPWDKEKIVELAKQMFCKRIGLHLDKKIGPEDYMRNIEKGDIWSNVIQPKQAEGEIKKVDILLPLNDMTDAAALGKISCFSNYETWLRETVSFVIENTNLTIMIRQHPAVAIFGHGEENLILHDLETRYKDENRLIVAYAECKINTYNVLKNCRVVIPWSSTVGVEAAIFNRHVIIHTDVYYQCMNFVHRVFNEKEYFDAIKTLGREPSAGLSLDEINQAYFTFFCLMNNVVKSRYGNFDSDILGLSFEWLDMSYCQLKEDAGVPMMMKCITEGVPILYSNIRKILEEEGM